MKIRTYKNIMIELHKISSEIECLEYEDTLGEYYQNQLTNIANELIVNKKYYDNYSLENLKNYESKLLDEGKDRRQYEQIKFIIKEKEIYDYKGAAIEKFQNTLNIYIAKDLFRFKNKKMKKAIIAGTLALMIGVSTITIGKANKSKQTQDLNLSSTKETTEQQIENTTKASTTEVFTTTEKKENINQFNIDNNEEVETLVEKNYKKYKKAYKSMNICENDIKNIVLLINNRCSTLTSEEIKNALYNINQIYIPQDIKNTLVSIANQKQGLLYDEKRVTYDLPKLSDLVSNQQIDELEEIKRIELSFKYITSTLQMKTYGDALVNSINNAVILMETNETENDSKLAEENSGVLYLESAIKKDLILYATFLNSNENYITYKRDGKQFKLQIRETESEMELKSKISHSIIENKPIDEDEMNKYTQIQNNLIGNKYEKQEQELEKQFILENRKNNKLVKNN